MYDCVVPDIARPVRGRAEMREVSELRALRVGHPELIDAVDLQIELLELYRRVQGRIPVPRLQISETQMAEAASAGRPLVPFEAIPIELTDLRLLVRQTADALHRSGLIELGDHARIQALGRDMGLLVAVGQWYRAVSAQRVRGGTPAEDPDQGDPAAAQVFALAVRPFLSRCAEVVQQHPDLSAWTCGHCAVCGGEADLAVITATGDRHLICGRCGLQWRFASSTCPSCLNDDPRRLTSFATPDGLYRVEACEACRRYLKTFNAARAPRPVMPLVDAVATLPLDAAAIQRGYLG